MKNLYTLALILLFSAVGLKSNATHFPGGWIEYECVGTDSFMAHLYLFRDCNGAPITGSELITATSTCGGSLTATLALTPDPVTGQMPVDVSQLCPADSLNSACFGGTLPGTNLHHYSGIVVLSPVCDTWSLSWNTCCRSTGSNLVNGGSTSIHLFADINTQTNPCNDSPSFINRYMPYMCIGETQQFSFAATDAEGDSLVYSLAPAMTGAGSLASYMAGLSSSEPISGITIDPTCGAVTVTPTMVGFWVVTVRVDQYDCSGNHLGTISQEMAFVTINCTSSVPTSVNGISNLTGGATMLDSMNLQACAGSSFCFDYVVEDVDTNDVLHLTNNIDTYWPGATVTTTGTNPMTINICWTAQSTCGGYLPLAIHVDDGVCPLPSKNVFPIKLQVVDATVSSGDVSTCVGTPAQLNVNGGSLFTWTVIAGDPIVVGSNFSCNPCANPLASPSTTTTYLVTSNLTGACTNTDTVTVTIAQPQAVLVTPSTNDLCIDSMSLQVTPGSGGYTYSWSPTVDLSDPNAANPTVHFDGPTITSYTVTVTDSAGCTHTGGIIVRSLQPSIGAMVSDTSICAGDTISLTATNGQSGYSYSWSPAADLFNPTSQSTDGAPMQTTTFAVVATDSSGTCSDTAFVDVLVAAQFNTGNISGNNLVIENSTETYSVSGNVGSTYSWELAGGAITAGQGTDNVTVDWGSGGFGSIRVSEISTGGCSGGVSEMQIEIVLGINDGALPRFDLNVAPNPFGNSTLISVDGISDYSIAVYDVAGKLILSEDLIAEPTYLLSSAALDNGTYFIRVSTADQLHSETKVIVVVK